MSYIKSADSDKYNDLVDSEIVPLQAVSLDERALMEAIDNSGSAKQLFAAALQLSVVGWGGDNYGDVQISGVRTPLVDIFDENSVLYKNATGARLKPGDLTPKRLVRVFRYQIQKWLVSNNVPSFLLRKYGEGKDASFKDFVFPGAEHLIEDKDEANALIECYNALDSAQGSSFAARVKTIFTNRNIEFDN